MENNETDGHGESTVNIVKIKKPDLIDGILENFLHSRKDITVLLFPFTQTFKSYLLAIKNKFLIIDTLMPFYGNKLVSKSEYIKIDIDSEKFNGERYFFTKFNDETIEGDEHNFIVHKPVEIYLKEKRKILRISTNGKNIAMVKLFYNEKTYLFPIEDLSWNSISFSSDIFIHPGSVLRAISIHLPEKSIETDLKVVHSTQIHEKFRIGCEIIDITDSNRDKLISFILSVERENIKKGVPF